MASAILTYFIVISSVNLISCTNVNGVVQRDLDNIPDSIKNTVSMYSKNNYLITALVTKNRNNLGVFFDFLFEILQTQTILVLHEGMNECFCQHFREKQLKRMFIYIQVGRCILDTFVFF